MRLKNIWEKFDSDEIVIGMGAGSISKHMRELKNNLWI